MNINIFNKKSKLKSLGFDVQIQCPDCGNNFVFNNNKDYICEKCKRIFTENEIRARCGL